MSSLDTLAHRLRPAIGSPDPATFLPTYESLTGRLDSFLARWSTGSTRA